MNTPRRDILVVVKNQFLSERAIEQEVACLHEILRFAESHEQFCIAHELVDRNRITQRVKKILRESKYYRLRPFRFLINKN